MEPIDTELFGIQHKPQAINSKVKGNKGELEASKLLAAWTGFKFKRIPQEWQLHKIAYGDIMCIQEGVVFPFNVEVKFYKNIGINRNSPILRKNSIINKFMSQCEQDAAASGKFPMLMVRENNMPKDLYYIFLKVNFAQKIVFINDCNVLYRNEEGSMFGFNSKKFFETITYEKLKELYGNKN